MKSLPMATLQVPGIEHRDGSEGVALTTPVAMGYSAPRPTPKLKRGSKAPSSKDSEVTSLYDALLRLKVRILRNKGMKVAIRQGFDEAQS